MKKHIALLLALLMLFLAVPMTAQAAGKPDITVNVNPSELVEGGKVNVSVEIYNPNEEPLSQCMLIIDGDDVKEYDTIPAGDYAQYNGEYNISTSKLGKNIPVQLTYTGGTQKTSFIVEKKAPTVQVNTTVKIDSSTVTKGKESTFTFAIENNGDTTMEGINLTASPLNNGKVLTSTFNLAAGKATIVTYSEALTEDTTVNPQIAFTVAGKDFTKTMNSVSIKVLNPDVKLTISSSESQVKANDDFDVEIYLENSGNAAFKSIELYDMDGVKIPTDKSSLNAGEYLSATKTMRLSETTEIGFTAKATDASGETYTFNSNVLKMYVDKLEADDYAKLLKVMITPKEENLEKAGPVSFDVEIENTADFDFSNLVLSEKTLGEINTIDVLKAGENEKFNFSTTDNFKETTTFEFVLKAKNPDEEEITIEIDPIEIKVSEKGGISGIVIFLIILGVIIIGVAVALIIILNKDKKKKSKETVSAQKRTAAVHGVNASAEASDSIPAPTHTVQRAKIKPAVEEPEIPEDMSSFGDIDEPEESIPEEPTPQEAEAPVRRVIRRREFDDRNNF